MVRGRALDAAHFGKADLEARLGELPCGFGTGEAAADDVNVVHGAAHSAAGPEKEPGVGDGLCRLVGFAGMAVP